MDTILFILTHSVMLVCAAIVLCNSQLDSIVAFASRIMNLISGISPLKIARAIYRLFRKESLSFKVLIINILNIGIQISNQFLK